jgi:hypothetical protein
VVIEAVVYYLNLGRGVPWMFGLFVLLVVIMDYAFTRTKWGRALRAVGGNREAARRAGINVKRIYASAFISARRLRRSAVSSPPRASPRPASNPAPATSTSTPSRRRSSAAPACSADAAAPTRHCSASSSSRPSPAG